MNNLYQLIKMREKGMTLDEIAEQYGESRQAVLDKFAAPPPPGCQPFLARASTAMCLIREGVRTTYPLMRALGYSSSSSTRTLIRKLKERGWAEEEEGLNGTLRLTPAGEQMVSHITLMPSRRDSS